MRGGSAADSWPRGQGRSERHWGRETLAAEKNGRSERSVPRRGVSYGLGEFVCVSL